PTGFSAAAIAAGAALFPDHCAECHGPEGRGDGTRAKSSPIPPADLTAAHLWEHSDGELFWWLTHGIDSPEGGLPMPGFAASLSDDDRWALIDYVRAHNAGVSRAAAGQWPRAVAAPVFSVRCADGTAIGLADLRGRVVRLIAVDRDSSTDAEAP